MPLIKPPLADPSLDVFDNGVGVLSSHNSGGGHVFTTRFSFWSPSSPLRMQWWIWYLVVWADGTRERSVEDYPPFIAVQEMKHGYLVVDSRDPSRSGSYDLQWLSPERAAAARHRWSITAESF